MVQSWSVVPVISAARFSRSFLVCPAGSVWVCVDDRCWGGERHPENSSSVGRSSCSLVPAGRWNRSFPPRPVLVSCPYFGTLVSRSRVRPPSCPLGLRRRVRSVFIPALLPCPLVFVEILTHLFAIYLSLPVVTSSFSRLLSSSCLLSAVFSLFFCLHLSKSFTFVSSSVHRSKHCVRKHSDASCPEVDPPSVKIHAATSHFLHHILIGWK